MALIALGVGGGIGAYKAIEVARELQKRGHEVAAILTRNARRFVTPLTFEAITRRRVVGSQWSPGMNADIEHIALAGEARLLLVAPATANVMARFAAGLADEFLTAFHLATRAPVLLAPSMNTHMLEHPATQANLSVLASRGVRFVEPGAGYLACGWVGKGRLAEPAEIAAAADQVLRTTRALEGRRIVVSAGPTCEDLDPVRFIGNRSTGKMGIAIAAEAAARGAQVTLVLGPTGEVPPFGVDVVRVRSAADMHAAVLAAASSADAVVMAAAVADYTPAGGASPQKLKKAPGGLSIELTRTRDILADLGAWRAGRRRPALVGFAAETEHVLEHAREKLAAKQVDLIVANDVSRRDAGFAVDANEATFVSADGDQAVPLQAKRSVAVALIDRIEVLLAPRRPVIHADRGLTVVRPSDPLADHLRYYAELGVSGFSRDATWRRRTAAGDSAVGAAARVGADSEPPGQVRDDAAAAASLHLVRSDLGDCSRCKLHRLGRTQIVFGVGSPTAGLMFVGEAPGADEDAQGVPFVGRAGQLLTKIIEAMGTTREQVYIANVIKCRPPGNRNPEPDEVAACEPFLFRQVDLIGPKVIVALGTFAAHALVGRDEPISRLRGQVFDYRGAKLIPTFHPAYLLRSPERKRETWDDMKLAMTLLADAR